MTITKYDDKRLAAIVEVEQLQEFFETNRQQFIDNGWDTIAISNKLKQVLADLNWI